MFFVDRPAKFVVNAQDIPCKCHPNLHSTFGRLLNHAVGKVEAVKNWQRPKNKKEVESFLGFANYHCEHIWGFANLTKCLYDRKLTVLFV